MVHKGAATTSTNIIMSMYECEVGVAEELSVVDTSGVAVITGTATEKVTNHESDRL